ncbi:hypothetical protein [Agromyces mangrovi Wang et al. 2018]|uniref:hypothetical protein n=1 Tax=Agromyces mangrovi TaxID=1858653 RepID=UPI0025729371|nr:hypothetical protein [Agromyces mangrovi]BDZ63474.1 hypothetical protein GCM10025877_04120 [Agromyces mangrovi]
MRGRPGVASALLCALLVTGCSVQGSPSQAENGSAQPSPEPVVLEAGERGLDPGTYRMQPSDVLGGAPYPDLLVTVPDGWTSVDGWVLERGLVAILLWNVHEVYGHPCRWAGTELPSGETVDDLVTTLVAVPLRNPSTPEPVEVDGRTGLYFEWSVPTDIPHDGEGFPDCDAKPGEPHDFVSWTGVGLPSVRYHQAPGQVDRIWVLDADGERLVIDAFSMPEATDAEIAEIHEIVDSIRFVEE